MESAQFCGDLVDSQLSVRQRPTLASGSCSSAYTSSGCGDSPREYGPVADHHRGFDFMSPSTLGPQMLSADQLASTQSVGKHSHSDTYVMGNLFPFPSLSAYPPPAPTSTLRPTGHGPDSWVSRSRCAFSFPDSAPCPVQGSSCRSQLVVSLDRVSWRSGGLLQVVEAHSRRGIGHGVVELGP